jgi:hypothetical protein
MTIRVLWRTIRLTKESELSKDFLFDILLLLLLDNLAVTAGDSTVEVSNLSANSSMPRLLNVFIAEGARDNRRFLALFVLIFFLSRSFRSLSVNSVSIGMEDIFDARAYEWVSSVPRD